MGGTSTYRSSEIYDRYWRPGKQVVKDVLDERKRRHVVREEGEQIR